MNLSIGIVGLPNAGKSTLFNTLLKRQIAHVAEYPFTTIEPNTGVVEVPDERLLVLMEMVNPEKAVPAAIKFIDIAGLVKDSHKGEGLGNKFLGHIRETDAVLHVVRDFENEKAPHILGSLDPKRDIQIVEEELTQAGIEKPALIFFNKEFPSEAIIDKLIKDCYSLLSLITFFTVKGGKQVQAWPVKKGTTVFEAAGLVHSDIARGFIKAEVINFPELAKIGSWQKAKDYGKIKLKGRDYLITDADVVEFKFGK